MTDEANTKAEEMSQAAVRLAEAALPEILTASGWLVVTDSENKLVASGTATLLDDGAARFVATSFHVVDELRKHAASFQLLTYPSPGQVLARANTFSSRMLKNSPQGGETGKEWMRSSSMVGGG